MTYRLTQLVTLVISSEADQDDQLRITQAFIEVISSEDDSVAITGDVEVTESQDTFIAFDDAILGNMSATEQADTFFALGGDGFFLATEDPDIFIAVEEFKGAMIANEFPNRDTFIALGADSYFGNMVLTEQSDTFNAAGGPAAKARRIGTTMVVGY